MARAETIENVGETGGGGNSCRMELPRPFQSWPGLLTTTTTSVSSGGSGALQPHHLHPLQALYLPYPLPYPHPEGQGEPQTHQQFPALSPSPTPPPSPSPPCNRKEETGCAPCAFSGEQSDLDGEEQVDASWRLGPLPDLLPQNEQRLMDDREQQEEEEAQELMVRRVAHQLRTIGDEYNATVLRRAHGVLHWQDWGDTFRGLLTFITQSLSTLYRLT
ncbi:uncharacterized protein LOC141786575 [Halichoeres trimaculatus]|uniref:uncharacterized protein LOC141786575 n=1 Tax=Halichoeres trimaculatus TaxID=147232 RepID=UPI003D9E8812